MAKDAKGHGSEKRGGLSVPEQHQFKIAKSTLRMSDAGASIMGGMNKDQARAFLTGRAGWSPDRVAAHEGADKSAAHELAKGNPKAETAPVHGGMTDQQTSYRPSAENKAWNEFHRTRATSGPHYLDPKDPRGRK